MVPGKAHQTTRCSHRDSGFFVFCTFQAANRQVNGSLRRLAPHDATTPSVDFDEAVAYQMSKH
jgi:hypothetical protein